MINKNIVYIAKSLDGYIAGPNGELEWLNAIPNPNKEDMGFPAFMNSIDALVMGRNTFEMVCSFGGEWPYSKPVFVLSHSLKTIDVAFQDKAQLVSGLLADVLASIHNKGFHKLYIDGGVTIQNFLKEDLIDELIVSTIPTLLGGGIPLFGTLVTPLEFEHVKSDLFLGQIVQDSYRRKR